MKRVLALALAAIMMATPAQAQLDNPNESTPTTLYFHIWDTFNKFVINTQPYNATFFDVGGVNFPTLTANSWDFNTLYGISTAGPVEYDFIEAGRPRIHPERGIAQDVIIDQSVTPMVYLYIDARGLDGGRGTPSVLPEMTFRATVRSGDDPGSDLDAGAIIMEGEVTATLMDGRTCGTAIIGLGPANGICAATVDPLDAVGYGSLPTSNPMTGNPILYPDENYVIEVAIPMTLGADRITKSDAYNIRLDYFQTAGGLCGEDECAQGNLRMVLRDGYLPRLDMNIMNPVYFEFIHPQVAAGTLLIHTGMNSPWGTFDIDVNNITIDITGPSEPQSLQRVVAQNQHVHGLHDKAAEITYLWNFRDEGAAQGEYAITMTVSNLHGTASATGTAGFKIEGKKAFGVADTGEVVLAPEDHGGENESPSVAMFATLALLGAAAVVARRRRAGPPQ